MEWIKYIAYGIALAIVLPICIVATVKQVKKVKAKKESKPLQVEPVVESNGVRYTPDAEIVDKEGNMNISYVKEDIILQPRKMVTVDKKGIIKPGKYTVLSAYENESNFNIRIGLFVKEYKHGQEIILAEGDEICPTSTTIILR